MISIIYILLIVLSQTAFADDIRPFFKVDMFGNQKTFIPNKGEVKSWNPVPPKNTSWNGSQDFFLKLASDNALDLFNRGKENDDDVKAIDDKIKHLGTIFSVKPKGAPVESGHDRDIVGTESGQVASSTAPQKDVLKYELSADIFKLKAVALMKTDYFELKSELIRTDLNTGIYIGNLSIVHSIVDRFTNRYDSLGFNKSF